MLHFDTRCIITRQYFVVFLKGNLSFSAVSIRAVHHSGKSNAVKSLKHLNDWNVNPLRRGKTVNCNTL